MQVFFKKMLPGRQKDDFPPLPQAGNAGFLYLRLLPV